LEMGRIVYNLYILGEFGVTISRMGEDGEG
jgi:hypothetical protein